MRYIVLDETEYAYTDAEDYESASDTVNLVSARGSYACAQILLYGIPANGRVNVRLEGLKGEIYGLLPIPVEANVAMPEDGWRPHCPERKAPFEVYDCLKPYDGLIPVRNGNGGLYIAIPIDKKAAAGICEGRLLVNDIAIPIRIRVYDVTVPAETLKVIQGINPANIAEKVHMTQDSDEFRAYFAKCLAAARRMRQNMMYTFGVPYERGTDGHWVFDFESYEKEINGYRAAGMHYFTAGRIGYRRSWEESTIYIAATNEETHTYRGSIPAMSYEAYTFLSEYLPKLQNFLEERGWLDDFCLEIIDEPNAANATEFRALSGLVHRLAPKIRLMDACSYGDLHGALDIWVPLNAEYQQHRKEIETFRTNGAEIWHYVCCVPRGRGMINRLMDCPLISTRYLFWGNFAYNLTGYLHWALAKYQPKQDAFVQSCPEHRNADAVTYLPAGDTHLLYPAVKEPWLSIRAEVQRAGIEDYELLRLLQKKDPARADAVCAGVFRAFDDVEYSVKAFRAAKVALLEALES